MHPYGKEYRRDTCIPSASTRERLENQGCPFGRSESIYVEVEYSKPDIVIAGKHFPIYDFRPERVWRHLDMWQYKTYIKARIPRCKLPDGKYASVQVPWADAGERMTELLEKKR